MKRLLIFCLALLLLGAWLGEKMVQDPGYVLFAYKDTTVETSLWVLLLIGLIAFGLLHLLLRFTARVTGSGRSLQRWRTQRGQRKAQRQTLKGLLALSEGRWSKAQRFLTLGAENADAPLVNYLAAARAAHEQNQPEACEELLQQARQKTPQAELAISITQAETKLKRGQLEPCLAILKRLHQQNPRHTYVLKLLQQVYQRLQDWQGIKALLPALRKGKVLDPRELESLEQRTFAALLQAAAENLPAEAESTQKYKTLQQVWSGMPNALQVTPPMVSGYARLLASIGAEPEAEKLVRDLLKRTWDDELVELYGRLAGQDPAKQLKQAQQWLEERPKDANLLLCTGRLALRNQLWGKARGYFEASLAQAPDEAALCELVRLLNHLGEKEASLSLLQESLGLLSRELPSLPMPEPKSA